MNIQHLAIKLARATTLPVFSKVVKQVLTLAENPNASAREYELVIGQDTALSAKIIRTANSTFYNRGAQITTLQRAIVQLGNSTIRSICLAVGFKSSVDAVSCNKHFDSKVFWQHSLAVACTAKLIACLRNQPLAEEAFMAGMMHDIGKLALAMFLPGEAEYVYRLMELRNVSQYEAEMEALKLSHQDIGQMVAERWELPGVYLSSITSHHAPPLEVVFEDPLVSYVHIANALTYSTGLGLGPAGEMNQVDPMIQDMLELDPSVYDKINRVVANEVAQLSVQMG
ncbi:MAG TPA: HDOD domain-containing protein [Chthonomonadaceae bacterium]|nr:HDOD domain-containing protein [Chthonomonadaceae bacterium]